MKTAFLLLAFLGQMALANETSGPATVYPMELQPETLVIKIGGAAAETLYRSIPDKEGLDNVEVYQEADGLDQKIGENITCNKKVKTKKGKKHISYFCEMDITHGVVGAGAAG